MRTELSFDVRKVKPTDFNALAKNHQNLLFLYGEPANPLSSKIAYVVESLGQLFGDCRYVNMFTSPWTAHYVGLYTAEDAMLFAFGMPIGDYRRIKALRDIGCFSEAELRETLMTPPQPEGDPQRESEPATFF